MRTLKLYLVLGWGLSIGCTGLDEGPATAPQQAVDDEVGSATLRSYDEPAPLRAGPSLRLPHEHAVAPADDLDATRRAMADLDPASTSWVEQQHRVALAVMLQAGSSTAADPWAPTLEAFAAATSVPSHMKYVHADELLFDYAAVAFLADDQGRAQEQLLSLIRQFPMSPLIPHAYALFADHMFEEGQLEHAAQLYSKLEHFDDPTVIAYAAYRTGWCHLGGGNGNGAAALEQFVRAIRASEKIEGHWGQDLRTAAMEDATLAYAQVGDPEEARAFFTPLAQHVQVDPEVTLRRLARAYDDLGDEDATEQICRELSSPC